ncbi:MAG: methyltransferase domain-containing protein [Planctomycetota bacterium]|nr:methyltransferase domain-containing protein [Planctomycetota bacterium]
MIRFFSQAVLNYQTTGSFIPSSQILAREMLKSFPVNKAQRVLEVGSGTGVVTKHILAKLLNGNEFHIVELNSEFSKYVEEQIIAPFQKETSGVKVVLHNASIDEAKIEGKFDTIICGLPFNNFPIDIVEDFFEVMFSHLAHDGEIIYFEYLGVRWLKRIFGFPSLREETKLRTVNIQTRFEKHQGYQSIVWRNIPSCRVVRLKG